MSEVKLVDVTIHIDKDTDAEKREQVESGLRGIDGVISVHMPDNEPHLVVVQYNPDTTESGVLLNSVQIIAGHAELVGL